MSSFLMDSDEFIDEFLQGYPRQAAMAMWV
jgi:hypothetical protein